MVFFYWSLLFVSMKAVFVMLPNYLDDAELVGNLTLRSNEER